MGIGAVISAQIINT